MAKLVADDPQLAEYRQRRNALVDTADNQRALAVWCKKHKLADEARIHWAKVLEFDPQDAEALAALGLELYNGRLLTKQQIIAAKKQAGEAHQALHRWHPQLVKWRNAIERGNNTDRAAALQGVKQIADPEAIPALEQALAVNGSGPKADELNLLLIETVGRMPVPDATQVLLRRAIMPDSEQVRAAAADELKKRPMFAYVPQLVAAMPDYASATTKWFVTLSPTGAAILHVEQNRMVGSSSHDVGFDAIINSQDVYLARKRVVQRPDRSLLNASAIVNSFLGIEAGMRRHETQNSQFRNRIASVLRRTTGFDAQADPEAWRTFWNEQKEVYTPSYAVPREGTHTTDYRSAAIQSTVVSLSCFPAGTPVATIDGERPIETVKIGDRVLAQHPATGQLAFKTIEGLTIRPAVPLLKITAGSSSVSATRGHPFWVDGQGWVLAKQLKVGQSLHSLDGAVTIDAIEELPAKEAYNLVVSDYGTYFVGQQSLLVHDNMPLTEIAARVPGLMPAVQEPR